MKPAPSDAAPADRQYVWPKEAREYLAELEGYVDELEEALNKHHHSIGPMGCQLCGRKRIMRLKRTKQCESCGAEIVLMCSDCGRRER